MLESKETGIWWEKKTIFRKFGHRDGAFSKQQAWIGCNYGERGFRVLGGSGEGAGAGAVGGGAAPPVRQSKSGQALYEPFASKFSIVLYILH
jgi:hypothetical protein